LWGRWRDGSYRADFSGTLCSRGELEFFNGGIQERRKREGVAGRGGKGTKRKKADVNGGSQE